MSGPANGATAPGALDLPAFSLDVQALDLGAGIKAVSLEILETESREPVRGKPATDFWSAVFPLLSAGEPFVLDFFSHLDRVREFCAARQIAFSRCRFALHRSSAAAAGTTPANFRAVPIGNIRISRRRTREGRR
jgi:hypothetical protein